MKSNKPHSHRSESRHPRATRRSVRVAARVHGRNALTLACLAAGVTGSAWKATQAPQPAGVAARAQAPVVQTAVVQAAVVQLAQGAAAPVAPVAAAPVQELAPVQAAPAPAPRPAPAIQLAGLAKAASPHAYYDQLRAQLRWVPVRVGGRELATPDAASRLLLAHSAAERAGLADVGLDYRDVYGVINAETTWVARTGMGRNGVASHGLAQFELATARAVGVRDVNDPVEAVHGAAVLLKEAAAWSARRIAGLGLSGPEHAARLREGVSVYYNLSSRARQRWSGFGSAHLPVETRRHIHNVRLGAQQAERLLAGAPLEQAAIAAVASSVATASSVAAASSVAPAGPATKRPRAEPAARRVIAAAKPQAPRALGTIAWSGSGEGEAGARSGSHVVWSNGAVTRQGAGRVRWSSGSRG